jgi:hypothetical protein
MTENEALDLYATLPLNGDEYTPQDCVNANKILGWWYGLLKESAPQDSCLNPVYKVYFRAGLLACREYMARFVEPESPTIAASIRANWWPVLGDDPGPPRKLNWNELTDGEYGTPGFRCKTANEVSPSIEALPVAMGFLEAKP